MKTKLVIVFAMALAAIGISVLSTFGGSPARAASDPEIQAAIEDGLAWLAGQQQPDGCWPSNYDQAATTGLIVWKFEEWAKEHGYANPLDPTYIYHSQVEDGLNCIFRRVQTSGGLVWVGSPYWTVYLTGIDMIAIASSNNPMHIVPALGSPVDGWTYQAVLQDMLDWMADAQNDGGCEIGGWSYHPNEVGRADNSNTGYATMGIGFAASPPPTGFGLAMPAGVASKLNTFINNVQRTDGGSDYDPCALWGESNILRTGNLLYEMVLAGRTVTDLDVQAAINFIDTAWNWQGDDQATFTMTKGLQAYGIDLLPVHGDWFDQTSTHIVAAQDPGGWWPGYDTWMTTAWYLLSMEPTAFVPPPRPTPGAVGGDVELRVEGFAPADVETGSPAPPYVPLAGAGAAAVLALTAGAWYARRRWLR